MYKPLKLAFALLVIVAGAFAVIPPVRSQTTSPYKVFLPIVKGPPIYIVEPLTATSWSASRIDIFGLGSNGHVLHRWYEGEWQPWGDLGAAPIDGEEFSGPIAAASWEPGRLDVFGIGRNGHLIHLWYEGGWQPRVDLGGINASGAIAVASSGPNRYDIFSVFQGSLGNSHDIFHYSYDGALHYEDRWAMPPSLDAGQLSVSITATSWGPGRLDVFGTAYDHDAKQHLFHRWYDGAWSWEDIAGFQEHTGGGFSSFSGPPTAASWGSGRLDVFGIGRNGHLVQLWYDNGWDWYDLEIPSGLYGPTATSWGVGRYDIFGMSNDHLVHLWYEGGWQPWEDLGPVEL